VVLAVRDDSASQAVLAFPLGMTPSDTSRFTSPGPESPSETGAVSAQRNGVDVGAPPVVDVAELPPLVPADAVPTGFVVVLVEELPLPDEPPPLVQLRQVPPPPGVVTPARP
jgi:hypothetical protein